MTRSMYHAIALRVVALAGAAIGIAFAVTDAVPIAREFVAMVGGTAG